MAQLTRRSTKKKFILDWKLSLVLIALTSCSLIAIYGASPHLLSFRDGSELITKQIVFIIIGLVGLVLLIYLGVDRLFTAIDIVYWILMVLLALLILDRWIDIPFIRPVNFAYSWIQVPGLGTIQPSEFMKAALIIKISNIINEHVHNHPKSTLESDLKLFWNILLYAIPPLVLMVLQPDTGIPLIIIVGVLIMLMMAGIHRYWIYFGLSVVALFLVFFFTLYYWAPDLLSTIFGGSYRLNRIYGWLDTENYIQTHGLQLYQGLLALGSAGWTGHGLAANVVTILEPQNDFIFAVISSNFGFLGAAFVLLLHLALDLLIIRTIYNNSDYHQRVMAVGFLGMILFQQIQNMGMVVGLLPITGITLPFISAGGSSLLSYVPGLSVIFHMSHTNESNRLH